MSDDEEECVDFISKFYPRFPHIIAQIFSFLTAKQLTIISCVCKKWRNACKDDTKARKRKAKYLKMIKKLRKTVGEENWPIQSIQKRIDATQSLSHSHTLNTTATISTTTRPSLKSVINVYQNGKTKTLKSCLTNTVNKDIESKTVR